MIKEVKIFGMPAEKGRWIFVALGFLMCLCLGTIYSWSVFRKPLEELWGISATASGLPFMLFLVLFASIMIFGGTLLDKHGPKIIPMIGGTIVALGYILASFSPNITILTICYSIIAGAGVGLVYGAPVALAIKWFPDKKGLAVGITIIGFGISPFIMAPLANSLIEAFGVLKTMFFLGVGFLVILNLLALPLKYPPIGWKPSGWTAPNAITSTSHIWGYEYSGALKTMCLYALWICFIIGTFIGLIAIGTASPIGQEIIGLSPAAAAAAVSIFAIFNGIGRPLFGWLIDKFTPRLVAVIMFTLMAVASMGMLSAGEGEIVLYILCFSVIWLCVGGWVALLHTSVAVFFGTKNYSKIHGTIFTGYGIGAVLGTLASGVIRDTFGSYYNSFYLTAALATIGIAIAFFLLRQPKIKEA